MAEKLSVCLFSSNEEAIEAMQQAFEAVGELRLLGCSTSWDELRAWIRHGGVDMVAVHLEHSREDDLEVVRRVAQLDPTCSILVLGGQTDPTSIIAAMRAGCSQFVVWPPDKGDLANAVERIRTTRQVAQHVSKRFCVIGSSGGVGTTMIASNLAMELSRLSNRRVALVDLDLEFGGAGAAFDCEPKFSIVDVCREGVEVDRLLLGKAMHDLPCNVSILARPPQVEDARTVSASGVHQMLQVMGEMYPYVVVDLPRAYSSLSAAAVAEADRTLVITQLSVPSIRNAARVYRCLQQMGADDDRIEIVLNRCKASFERITPDEVEAHFSRPVFAMIPNDYRRVQSSLDLGHPVMFDDPDGPSHLAIQEMARKLASDHLAEEPIAAAAPGLLSKLWRRSPKTKM